MRILFVEHLTASPAASGEGASLADEGWAMLSAAARDVSELPNVSVAAAVNRSRPGRALPDAVQVVSVGEHPIHEIASASADFDGVVVIAPEIDAIGVRWTKTLEAAGARLLSPPSRFVEWASDKSAVARSLPCESPRTLSIEEAAVMDGPIVVKPRDGVGSMFTVAAESASLPTVVNWIRSQGFNGELIVQPRLQGRSMSVAVVGRRNVPPIVLPAVEQLFEHEDVPGIGTATQLQYRGGRTPMHAFDDRIRRLVDSLWSEVESFDGWFGVDVLLADDGNDSIVDINPRLTTSYLGYSRLLPGATARLLLGLETADDLERLRGPFECLVEFDTAGKVVQSQRQ